MHDDEGSGGKYPSPHRTSINGTRAAADRSGVAQAPAEDCYMQSLDVRMVGQASYPVGDDDRNHDYTTSSTDPNTLTAMATDGLAPVHPLAREATWES